RPGLVHSCAAAPVTAVLREPARSHSGRRVPRERLQLPGGTMSVRVELTVAAVTWRLLMGRRRWLLAILVNLLPPFVAWLFIMEAGAVAADVLGQFYARLMGVLVLTVLLPLAGL